MSRKFIIILIIFVSTCFNFCTFPNNRGKNLFGQNNAVWCESLYLRGYNPGTGNQLTAFDIQKFANTLKAHHIKYAYLFAGPYEKDGHLPKYPFSDTAARSVKIIKEIYPELTILPWIGGVQNKTVFLGNPFWVTNALTDTKRLVRFLNVTGVHIDLEFIKAGDPYLDSTIQKEKPGDLRDYGKNVNTFHRKLRSLLPDCFISSVVVATSPDTKPWKRKTSLDELNELTKYINQLSFLYYDTTISDEDVFEQNCDLLVADIQKLKKVNNIQYLIAIGTFVNRPELRKYRDLKIENIPNTLNVIKKSIRKINDHSKLVDGIAIFCNWQTSASEWEQIEKNWIN
jgi:hypothetical protein